jgi:hypothetical protein
MKYKQLFSLRLNTSVLTLFMSIGTGHYIYSGGNVLTDILDGTSEEKVGIRPIQQFDSEAYKLIGKRDDKSFLHLTVFLISKFLLCSDQYLSEMRVCSPVPNTQKFVHTRQRCAPSLHCGDCGEPGHGIAPCPGQPH